MTDIHMVPLPLSAQAKAVAEQILIVRRSIEKHAASNPKFNPLTMMIRVQELNSAAITIDKLIALFGHDCVIRPDTDLTTLPVKTPEPA